MGIFVALMLTVISIVIVLPRVVPSVWWLAIRFPIAAISSRLSWRHVTDGCGLTKIKKRRFREPAIIRPRLGIPRPHRYGYRIWMSLKAGQTPDTIRGVAEQLAHAWRMHTVRVHHTTPGRVQLSVTARDPLARVAAPTAGRSTLRSSRLLLSHSTQDIGNVRKLPVPASDVESVFQEIVVGRLETGDSWALNLVKVPHWLIVGATQSGKSTLLNALIATLAPLPVALVGFDLKGGVELTPYSRRMSAIATSRAECVGLLKDLLNVINNRMTICKDAGVRNIWKLPTAQRPAPLVVFIDEVAELYLAGSNSDKDDTDTTAALMLRAAQLGRAFGIHLIIAGQRVGSDLGKGVTALRSQLTGRICFRVNDEETAKMTLTGLHSDALAATQAIPPDTPGVAITTTTSGMWHRARTWVVTETEAETAARDHAHLSPQWSELTRLHESNDGAVDQ